MTVARWVLWSFAAVVVAAVVVAGTTGGRLWAIGFGMGYSLGMIAVAAAVLIDRGRS